MPDLLVFRILTLRYASRGRRCRGVPMLGRHPVALCLAMSILACGEQTTEPAPIEAKSGTVSDTALVAVYTMSVREHERRAGSIYCQSSFGLPDTVAVGECITVRVSTAIGGGDRPGGTDVTTEGLTATVEPWD